MRAILEILRRGSGLILLRHYLGRIVVISESRTEQSAMILLQRSRHHIMFLRFQSGHFDLEDKKYFEFSSSSFSVTPLITQLIKIHPS